MWFKNYFRSLNPTPTRRTLRSTLPAPRRYIEALEDRRLLSFTPFASYSVGANPQAVATADFDNDGFLDLVTANTGGNTVSVRLGVGGGGLATGFGAASHFVTDAGPSAVAVGDFDNDGNLDLVTATSSDKTAGPDLNTISVLKGNGNGTFQPRNSIVTTSGWLFPSLAVADFNDDGNLDLVHTTVEDFQFEPSEVMVMLGDGAGGFAYSGEAYPSTVPVGLAVADLNDDSWPDVVAANAYSDNVSIMLGGGDGTLSYSYTGSSEFAAGPSLRAVAVGDFNGDGIPDLVTAGQTVDILLGLGGGVFAAPVHYSTNGSGQTTVAAADFNGDGKLDVITMDPGTGTMSVLLGLGDGNLGPPIDHAAGSSPTAVTVGDFNGDGRPDVAAADTGSNAISVLLNDGNWSAQNTPQMRIADAMVTEGNTGTVAAVFTVTLSAPSDQPVTVAYATVNTSAVANSDYQATSGTLTFAPGDTSKTISVQVKGDRTPESNETFYVNLSGATGATIVDGQGVGTIVDDEPRISISDVSKKERNSGTTSFVFTVSLSATYDAPVSVNYATANGTATTNNNDYIAKNGLLTFAPGETSKTITISVKGDTKKESNESFFVKLSNASGGLIDDGLGLGTIVNDDGGRRAIGRASNQLVFAAAVDAAIEDWMTGRRRKRWL